MAMQIRKASRSMTNVKVMISGPSGSGKTYGALLMAQGMIEKMPDLGGNSKRIGFIGTESSRDELYADQFDYDVISLTEDEKNPNGYNAAFDAFVGAGCRLIIIDSLTHLWNWVQEKVREDEANPKIKSNGVSLWGKWKKVNKEFQEKILFSQVHVIATARGKDEYVMETDDRGKLNISKVGVGSQQDKDTEYEFMVTLQIDQKTHLATATKDNTHLWDGDRVQHPARVITKADGEAVMDWALNGTSKEDMEELQNLRTQITDTANQKGGSKNAAFMKEWYEAMDGRNLNKIMDKKELKKILNRLKKVKSLEEQEAEKAEKAEEAKEEAKGGKKDE